MNEKMEKMTNDMIDHLEFSIEHGGFDPQGQGGCSCSICQHIMGYLLVHFYIETGKMFERR